MNYYEISSPAGIVFGTFTGETEQEARDACARDAGYESEADAQARTGMPCDFHVAQVAAIA